MPSFKSLFTNTERRFYPEVVVPLARSPASAIHESGGEKGGPPSDHAPGYSSASDRGSLQEKGVAAAPSSGGLTLEMLRAEVEEGVVAGGHDSIYDRTW